MLGSNSILKWKNKEEQRELPVSASTGPSREFIYWIALGLIIAALALIRVRLLPIPFERDEGEYAYMGRLILQGIVPYKEAYSMKLPGTDMMYAVIIFFFGQSIEAIHLGLLIINAATILFLFLLAKKIINSFAALLAAATYGITSLSPHIVGFAAHAAHFVIFFAIPGIYLLFVGFERKRSWYFLLSGFMLGMAFLMKQHGLFFVIFAGIMLLYIQRVHRVFSLKTFAINGSLFAAGILTPYLMTLWVVYAAGVFEKFWFWTFTYAREYATPLTLKDGIYNFKTVFGPIVSEFALLWVFAGLGLAVIIFADMDKDLFMFMSLFSLFSLLSVCPGLHFRHHYFIQILPAFSLLVGVSLSYLNRLIKDKWKRKYVAAAAPILVFALAVGSGVFLFKGYYFRLNPLVLSKMIYGATNFFPESMEIGAFIKAHSNENDKIAILGSEPQILFYADRSSATGYIYTYGLMEINKYNRMMQEEMISEIEKEGPEFIIFCKNKGSWLVRPGSPMLIFEWADQYVWKYYDVVGLVDITGEKRIVYKWFEDTRDYVLQSEDNILIFKKKDS